MLDQWLMNWYNHQTSVVSDFMINNNGESMVNDDWFVVEAWLTKVAIVINHGQRW